MFNLWNGKLLSKNFLSKNYDEFEEYEEEIPSRGGYGYVNRETADSPSVIYSLIGENMLLYHSLKNKIKMIINLTVHDKFMIIDELGYLRNLTLYDFDESVPVNICNGQIEFNADISDYKNGVCKVVLNTFKPQEYTLCGFIDKRGKVLLPFRKMEEEKVDEWRKMAEKLLESDRLTGPSI